MLTSAVLIGCLLAGQPATATDDSLELQVRQLVDQLNAARLAERDAAEAELLEMGPQVLDLLPMLDDRTPAEVVERLGRVRQKLQLIVAKQAAQPSLITIPDGRMPLSEVLAAIESQTGNKVLDLRGRFGQQAPDTELKVHFDKTPFWQALDEILPQAGLMAYDIEDEQRAIRLVEGSEGMLVHPETASYCGPFRFQPVRIEATRSLLDSNLQSLRLVVSVLCEPRLKPIALSQRMADVEAFDENGNPLTTDDTGASLEVLTTGSGPVELSLPLKLPSRDVKKIARLQGKIVATLPGKIETFRFDDLTKGEKTEQRIASCSVTLQQVRQNGPIWEVCLQVAFDEGEEALESYRGWMYDNEAYLEGPEQEEIPYDTLEALGMTENQFGVAYGFVLDDSPAEYTFVYKTTTVIMATGIEYEIKDIDLP